MKLLMNNKEIAHFLLSLIDYTDYAKTLPIIHKNLESLIYDFYLKKNKWIEGAPAVRLYEKYELDDNSKLKLKDKLFKNITKDLRNHLEFVRESIENKKEENYHLVHENIEYFIEKLGLDTIFELYRESDYNNFIKSLGLIIDPEGEFMRRKDFADYEEDALIRNTVGNEELLVTKIDNGYPMWFVDSGFTNFVEPSKKWHRLVRNHLHYGTYFDAPPDRLGIFREYPHPWRESGEFIYIIEPGPFAASIFHADLKSWKYDVEAELRKYTDKPIRFREKAPKRERTNLYKELLEEDCYCVVSINSNAATEAIWAGIPAITLDKHVTNPVTRSKLSDINDLYKENIAHWLAYLSYNQFTKEELMNGTAYDIVRKWHA